MENETATREEDFGQWIRTILVLRTYSILLKAIPARSTGSCSGHTISEAGASERSPVQ